MMEESSCLKPVSSLESGDKATLNRWLMEALDHVAMIGSVLHTDLELGKDPQAVFDAVKPVIRRLASFETVAFVLVGEEDLDFHLVDCDPPQARGLIQNELNKIIADGTFACSLYQNRLVVLPGRNNTPRLALHVLATRFRVVGVFLGILREDSPLPFTVAEKLLSIVLHNCASALEAIVLYEKLKYHNQNLEQAVEEKTRELRAAKEAAEEAAKAKTQFLANISHELRTPLNGIIGTVELLAATQLTEEQKELLESLRDSTESLLSLVNELLDFSSLESHTVSLEEKPFVLKKAVTGVAESFAARAFEKKLDFIIRTAPDLPEVVIGDGSRFRQVLKNLLDNAVKFTEKGKIFLNVECQDLEANRAEIVVSVEDTGVGIPPDKIDKIFDKFTQVDGSPTRRFGGVGIGLSLAKELVELMGGRIEVTSTPGEGTAFSVFIPFKLPEETKLQQNLSGKKDLPVSRDLILLGASEEMRMVVSELARSWGGRAISATDIRNCLKLYSQEASDGSNPLILLDQLPSEEDFPSRIESLRKKLPHSEIIACVVNEAVGSQALQKGASLFILKPLSSEKLSRALSKV